MGVLHQHIGVQVLWFMLLIGGAIGQSNSRIGLIDLPLHKRQVLSPHHWPSISTHNGRRAAQFTPFEHDLTSGLTASKSVASYVAQIEVGEGTYDVIVDTGSADLLLVGHGCQAYGKSPNMDIGTGSPSGVCTLNAQTYPNTGTNTGISAISLYGGPKTRVFANYTIYVDSVSISGKHRAQVYMGSIFAQTEGIWGRRNSTVAGLLGLGYRDLSAIYKAAYPAGLPYLDTLVDSGMIGNAFSMCFNAGGDGGRLVLGGNSPRNLALQYTPMQASSYYAVALLHVKFGSATMDPPQGGVTIVDSGNTLLSVSPAMLLSLKTEMCALAGNDPSCVPEGNVMVAVMEEDEVGKFPPIIIELESATVEIPPQNYWLKISDNTYQFGVDGITPDNDQSPSIILGSVFLAGQWLVFDRENSRIGLADCPDCDAVNVDAYIPQTVTHSGASPTATAQTQNPTSVKSLAGFVQWDCMLLLLLLSISIGFM